MIELKFTGPTLESVLAQVRAYLEGSTAPEEAYTPKVPQPAKEAPASVAPKPAAPEPVEAEQAPETPVPSAHAITYDDVSLGMLKLSRKTNRDTVMAFLARFGAKGNAKEIDPASYPEVMAALEQELA